MTISRGNHFFYRTGRGAPYLFFLIKRNNIDRVTKAGGPKEDPTKKDYKLLLSNSSNNIFFSGLARSATGASSFLKAENHLIKEGVSL
uniref:Uncharacterized protein n=1 Tax=Arundo donax TaxID=35708 RepID=A0A0A9HLN6_ARUDO